MHKHCTHRCHFVHRHRLLALDSVELLILSGDVRCFRILDPPLAAFCATLIRPRLSTPRLAGTAGTAGGAGAGTPDPLRGNMSMAPNTQLDPQGETVCGVVVGVVE